MNEIEIVVIEVLSKPYFRGFWFVDVKVDRYGDIQRESLNFHSRNEAEQIEAGHTYSGFLIDK